MNLPIHDAPHGYRFLVQCFDMNEAEAMAWVKRAFHTARNGVVLLKKGVMRASSRCGALRFKADPHGGYVAYVFKG